MHLFTTAFLSISLIFPAAALADQAGKQTSGKASWYQCCKRTANGERFNPDGHTAAHRHLPFGSKVLIENVKNGRSVVVRINDRGPFVKSRLIDLSRGAAKQIGLTKTGTGTVKMTVLAMGV